MTDGKTYPRSHSFPRLTSETGRGVRRPSLPVRDPRTTRITDIPFLPLVPDSLLPPDPGPDPVRSPVGCCRVVVTRCNRLVTLRLLLTILLLPLPVCLPLVLKEDTLSSPSPFSVSHGPRHRPGPSEWKERKKTKRSRQNCTRTGARCIRRLESYKKS